ncbi:unnamed protein product [Cuscuta campestris]|uniref:Ubiquitin-like protease family profile domain-containing protein n=2 Tax=Cuscuta campestris TaxID=132261 RepID=A0A484N1G2_9ASTE|nr:unnamed protein product [Cuscuta campestris]
MANTKQNAQAGGAIQKPILRSSPRHKKPEGLSDRNELQCHSSPKPELRKSPRLKRKDRPSTLTVVQALSGSRSKNVQSHSTPLPVTPKLKPISDNVQKQIKQKRKREEVESESVAKPSRGGLKLRKRGCVSMHRVVKRKINGQKPTVLFNDKGQPYGVAAAEMQSYIGVLARIKAPIWFDTWRQVPVTIKNKIWKSVTLGFDLPFSAQKLVLQSANSKWKQFKSTLTCKYILPFRDEPERLRNPPEDFSFLEKNHWDIFVADRLSPEFLKVHDEHYPLQLKRLWLWAKEALSDDRAHTFVLNKDAFGVEKKLSVFLSDIHALCARGEMAGSIITLYIHCLYELVKKNKMLQMISFVDPGMVGTLACGNIGQRSRKLADRFKGACDGQHFLIPFNDVNHWALTVVKPNEEVVYYMDPLKRRIYSQEWTEVVDNAIVFYKNTMNTPMLKKKVSWENMAGIPMQKGSVDCGLFVMRYMKEICQDKEV